MNSQITLEVCSNEEWLREFGGFDFETNDQAAEFKDNLFGRLIQLGFEVEWARGQRCLCHGWNGANTFNCKIGPVGTFDAMTSNQTEAIEAAIDEASAAIVR